MGKIIGFILIFVGGIVGIYALNMATNTPKSEVVNFGLLFEQLRYFIIAGILIISGTISFAADEIISAINPEPEKKDDKQTAEGS